MGLSLSVSKVKSSYNTAGSQSTGNNYSTKKESHSEEIEPNNVGCSSAHMQVQHGIEAWSYKIDEIDPSVIDELPPEIQQEFRAWLRPHKRPNVIKRGSSITHYFSPNNK